MLPLAFKELAADEKLLMFEVLSNGTFKTLITKVVKECERQLSGLSPIGNTADFMVAYAIAQCNLELYKGLLDFLNETFAEQAELYGQEKSDAT